jgi:hypothetical protein
MVVNVDRFREQGPVQGLRLRKDTNGTLRTRPATMFTGSIYGAAFHPDNVSVFICGASSGRSKVSKRTKDASRFGTTASISAWTCSRTANSQ